MGGTPTGIGAVEIFLAPGFAGGYANVVVDLDRNGLEPDTDPAQGGDWWVQNFPIVIDPASPTGSVAMTFALGTIAPSGNYDVYASFTSSPVTSPSLTAMVLTAQVPFGIYDIGALQSGTKNGRFAGATAPTTVARASGPIYGTTTVQWLVSGGRVLVDRLFGPAHAAGPNGQVRLDTPGILQGQNECGPTAAAQSLLWLQNTQGLQGLPAQDQLIDQLKRAMEPAWTSGPYPGVTEPNFVTGKDTVVQDLNLPVVTTPDGSPGAAGTVAFIESKMAANADVELAIAYPTGGGHFLTVAGWYDDGSTQALCFKDPLSGGQTVDCYAVFASEIPLYKYGDALIEHAVAESVVTTTTTTTLGCGVNVGCGDTCGNVPGVPGDTCNCLGPANVGSACTSCVFTPFCRTQNPPGCLADADCPPDPGFPQLPVMCTRNVNTGSSACCPVCQ